MAAKKGQRHGARGGTVTRTQRSKLVAHYAEWGIRHAACKYAGVSTYLLDSLIECDAEFAQEWADAKAEALASLEMEAIRRGRDGWDEPIITRAGPLMIPGENGELKAATIRRYDTKLLERLLAANDPSRYGSFAGQQPAALPEDMKPDPAPTPDEPGPEKPVT